MSQNALPCIVCGSVLTNVEPHVENQPDGGLTCITYGQYGSTVFVPMNGEFLEFNVCDPCMVKAGERGRVLSARTKRPVEVHPLGQIGWEHGLPYAPVQWTNGLAGFGDDSLNLDPDELDRLPPKVHLFHRISDIRRWLAAKEKSA